MKREKRLTKRERKMLSPPRGGARANESEHIHCVACGRHLDPVEFQPDGTAKFLKCQHGSQFGACLPCERHAIALLNEHDRLGTQVQAAKAWH